MSGQTIRVEVVREVSDDALLNKPLRAFFERCMMAMHAYAAEPGHVPIDTGNLRGSLAPGAGVTRVDDHEPPEFAVVGTRVDYGGYLNEPVKRDPHYRGGPSQGQRTEGWLTRTLDGNGKNIGLDDIIGKLKADIESAWKAG